MREITLHPGESLTLADGTRVVAAQRHEVNPDAFVIRKNSGLCRILDRWEKDGMPEARAERNDQIPTGDNADLMRRLDEARHIPADAQRDATR